MILLCGISVVLHPSRQESRVFNRRIRDRIVDLAVLLEQSEDENEFQSHMAAFYGEYGVGKFGLNKAFRIIEKEEEHKDIRICGTRCGND